MGGVENALVSYCRYIGKLFYPANLSPFYPRPEYWPAGVAFLSGFVLIVISILVIVWRRQQPYLFVGWLWFVGTLVPVIGLVQVGDQSMADRYTYVPTIGLLVLFAWGAHDLTKHWRSQAKILCAASIIVILLFTAFTCRQISYWRDSETLFRHAIAVTENNYLAHNNLGSALIKK